MLDDIDPDVWKGLCFYGTLVLMKTWLMSFITAVYRTKNCTPMNEEDARMVGRSSGPNREDEEVERVRRCHQNDVENVFLFCLLAIFYVIACEPTYFNAMLHFRIFVASRFLHTICYLFAIPMPSRLIAFLIGIGACASLFMHTFIAIGHEYF